MSTLTNGHNEAVCDALDELVTDKIVTRNQCDAAMGLTNGGTTSSLLSGSRTSISAGHYLALCQRLPPEAAARLSVLPSLVRSEPVAADPIGQAISVALSVITAARLIRDHDAGIQHSNGNIKRRLASAHEEIGRLLAWMEARDALRRSARRNQEPVNVTA